MKRETHTIDAAGEVLGRLATRVAVLLQGKGKVTYERRVDGGDFVKIINAAKIKLTGQKMDKKILYHHSWHPGGLKEVPIKRAMAKDPTKVLYNTIAKMLPRNKQRKMRLARLDITA